MSYNIYRMPTTLEDGMENRRNGNKSVAQNGFKKRKIGEKNNKTKKKG